MDETGLRYCTGPFIRLADHIPPIMTACRIIEQADLLTAIMPEALQPLFRAFVVTLKVVAQEQSQPAPSALVLQYRNKISSVALGSAFTEYPSLLLLPGKLQALTPLEKQQVQILDLSYNNLSGVDIAHVIECVHALRPVRHGSKKK